MQRELEERKNAFMNQRAVSNKPVQPSLCDEIDKLTDALTDREFSIINENPEFRESQEAIASIMNREYLRIMRPVVEGTADGKEALENHLTYLKLMNDLFIEVNPIPVKSAMNMMGLNVGPMRLPLCEMSEEHQAVLRASLQEAGLL